MKGPGRASLTPPSAAVKDGPPRAIDHTFAVVWGASSNEQHLNMSYVPIFPLSAPFASVLLGDTSQINPELEVGACSRAAPPVAPIDNVGGISVDYVETRPVVRQNRGSGVYVPTAHRLGVTLSNLLGLLR